MTSLSYHFIHIIDAKTRKSVKNRLYANWSLSLSIYSF